MWWATVSRSTMTKGQGDSDGIDAFAGWAAALDLSDVPDDVVRLAEAQVANQLGGAFAARPSDGDALTAAIRADAADGSATLLTGGTADPATAIAANQTLAMLHDNDDYMFMAHAGQSAVFSSLALAEHHGRDADAFLRAVIVADELAGRLGASTLVGPHNGQMWAHVHAAATAAATVLLAPGAEGTDAGTGSPGARAGTAGALADAVRHALYEPVYPTEPAFMDGESKALTAANASASGLNAGRLALGGGRGAPDALTGAHGFLDALSFLPFPEMLTGWGDSWVTRTLCVKPSPGCAYMQAPMQAYREATGDRDLGPDDVAAIDVGASLPTVVMEAVSRPHRSTGRVTPVNATFSVPYSLAAGIVAGEYDDGALSREAIDDDLTALHQVAERVALDHDWSHTAALFDGVAEALDARAMLGARGRLETLRGLRTFREEHARVSTAREAWKLVSGGHLRAVVGALRPAERWPEPDLRHADFDAMRFDFGASVTVETRDGEELSAKVRAHDGACGDTVEERRGVAERKLKRAVSPPAYREAAEDLAAVAMDLEGRALGELGDAIAEAADEFPDG